MLQKKLLALSLITIILISVLHHAALSYHWYFTHRWIDIVIHIMGGFWIAVTAFWLTLVTKHDVSIVHDKKYLILIIFLSVIIVGFIWEVFEVYSGNAFMHTSNYWTDSISDMINNCIGGAIVYAYLAYNKKSIAPQV